MAFCSRPRFFSCNLYVLSYICIQNAGQSFRSPSTALAPVSRLGTAAPPNDFPGASDRQSLLPLCPGTTPFSLGPDSYRVWQTQALHRTRPSTCPGPAPGGRLAPLPARSGSTHQANQSAFGSGRSVCAKPKGGLACPKRQKRTRTAEGSRCLPVQDGCASTVELTLASPLPDLVLFNHTISMPMSAGETPEMRDAWPNVAGRIFASF